ncbi:ABC transporter substrate-binding protein [Paucibacter sp. M5-1]|uniref:ABC transporter substrate-binding protein n=1 Tax=Paucibacter sp. M5-1 TaxID=3015998 RepID=UPI0022B8A0C1|nr:ABC transporter substrate-binding protein [Paucibacter sp. M5-1]MCZ7881682.1 ABC transporter substrate-binding protein [Paucibacter sp. M5-1]
MINTLARAGLAGLMVLQLGLAQAQTPSTPPKVLRYAFVAGETGFDPAQINDLYSRIVASHIFDGLYKYDYLARPYKIKPNAAAALPEVADNFRSFTIRIKPGLFFSDDPAFKGRKRELVAEDYVYSLKRFFDPATKSPAYSSFNDQGILGLNELRQDALKSKKPFDYNAPVEGMKALDRYTLQFKLKEPRPRFIEAITGGDQAGAVAREVIEHYGDKTMEHPVGTGPFMLKSWRRSSQLVLERNPNYREAFYDAEPNAEDAAGQALLARFKGRRLPMVDRVEISIIETSQPRWLAFLNREFDLVSVPLEFSAIALPQGELAPNLAKQGIQLQRIVNTDRTLFYFNMEDPVVGGYTPEKVALRRAISLATDVGREIQTLRRGQAVPAQTIVAPGTWGYDPELKTENSDFDLPRAKALLDIYGYKDADGDGWRDFPDGKPMLIGYASQPDDLSRSFDEMWKKNMDALGVRIEVRAAQWPEQLKAAKAGQLPIWMLGFSDAAPDVQPSLDLLYSPSAGGQNLSRFKNERFDEIYRQMRDLPNGPERLALLREAQKINLAYMPQKYVVHRIINDLTQPWLIGFKRPIFGNVFWQYVDVDMSQKKKIAS